MIVPRYQVITLSMQNKIARTIWNIVYWVLFRSTPNLLHPWRSFLLRIFGAKIGKQAHIYPSAKIWAPWNLRVGDRGCLGPDVNCYNVAYIDIGSDAVVSQRSFLCTATHDYQSPDFTLMAAPITLKNNTWIAAEVFVGPGVTAGVKSIAVARSVVLRDMLANMVYQGNPAQVKKERVVVKN